MPAQDFLHAFPNQEKDEAVFVFARPYWLAFLPTAIFFVVVFAFSLILEYFTATRTFGSGRGLIILGLGIFQLFAVSVFLVAVIDFYFDIFIVTDQRVVDIDQEQLFYRKLAQLNLENVEDVNSEVKGLFPTLFHYGTVRIQTAGERENFVVPNVRYPNEIVGIVSSLSEQAKRDVPEEERYPETTVIAVVDSVPYTDPAALEAIGAMVPGDLRLTHDRG